MCWAAWARPDPKVAAVMSPRAGAGGCRQRTQSHSGVQGEAQRSASMPEPGGGTLAHTASPQSPHMQASRRSGGDGGTLTHQGRIPEVGCQPRSGTLRGCGAG